MKTAARIALISLALLAAGCTDRREAKLPGSVIKVLTEGGHGSGVHIGNGYVLTAAHVAGDATDLKLKTDRGAEGTLEVLWVNKALDVALLYTRTKLAKSDIRCVSLPIGTPVRATGNPADQEFVSTWGKIGGGQALESPWKVAQIVSVTIVPGMSGGGMFDEENRLVGILVGVMARQSAFSMSPLGIGYVVPTSAFCGMLGR